MKSILQKAAEAVMPTDGAKITATCSLAIAFFIPFFHGITQRLFKLSVGQADAVITVCVLVVLFSGALGCIFFIARANYRLISELDIAASTHNENAAQMQKLHAERIASMRWLLKEYENKISELEPKYKDASKAFSKCFWERKKIMEENKALTDKNNELAKKADDLMAAIVALRANGLS